MSADPFKTLRDRQLQYQAEPVVLVDPATGEAGAIRLSGSTAVAAASQSVTIGSVAQSLAAAGAAIPEAAQGAYVTVEGAGVRFWTDGTLPTGSSGHKADAGDGIILSTRDQLLGFTAICLDGVSATLHVSFYLGRP